MRTGLLAVELKLPAHATRIVSNRKLIYVIDDALLVTVLKKGKIVRRLSGHSGKIRSIAFSEQFIFTAGEDRTIRRWHGKLGHCMEVLKGHKDAVNDLRYVAELGVLYRYANDRRSGGFMELRALSLCVCVFFEIAVVPMMALCASGLWARRVDQHPAHRFPAASAAPSFWTRTCRRRRWICNA